MRHITLTASSMLLAACATGTAQQAGPAKVNPASIAANPSAWNGRDVEVVGLVVWEFENLGLYQSYGAYCRGAEKASIAVDWGKWPGVSKADNRRMAMVRGKFTTQYLVPRSDGTILASSGASGPGPLEPGLVVRWLSPPKPRCPKALP